MKKTLTYFKIIIFASLLGSLNFILPISGTYFNFNLSGWAWIVILITSIYYIMIVVQVSYFSFKIWGIWVILLLSSLVLNFSLVGLQGTIQFIIPLLVAYVTGGLKYDKKTIYKIASYFKYLIIIILISTTLFSYIRFGIFGYGPATFAHLATIAGVLALSLYYNTTNKRYIMFYCLILLIPVLAMTRMGIFVLLLIPIIHFHKIFSFKKVTILILIIPLSIYIFNLSSFQEKMFYDNEGSIKDISYSSDQMNFNGRIGINELLISSFKLSPLLGNGPRFDYFILKKNNMTVSEAHNDYLQILVCYGIIGLLLFLSSFILQIIKIKNIQIYSKTEKLIKITILTLVIPLILFMFTDTVLRMTYSFINYFFALIGILMAVKNQNYKINKYNNENNSSYSFI
jgi:O-antigen ligase